MQESGDGEERQVLQYLLKKYKDSMDNLEEERRWLEGKKPSAKNP